MAGLNSHIIGWGKYLPSKVLTNAELAQNANIDPNWVKEQVGIEERHVVEPKQASADMGTRAAHAALKLADVSASQLDLVIAATNTPDYLFPATACQIQDALGADHAAAFDLAAGCSGFVYALVTADQFIRTGAYRYILIVGVETVSRILDWHDRNCAFFGDGAGAVVLAAGEQPGGLVSFVLSSDGSGSDLLILPAGGSRYPLTPEVLEQGMQYGRMDGRGVYRYGVRSMTRMGQVALRKARLTPDDIDLFIPHQTNLQLIQQVTQRLKIPPDRAFINVARYANISSAAIPVSLCDAIEAGKIQPGHRLLMTVFGGGLTSAGLVWQWSQSFPLKPMSPVRRFWHALSDAQAAFRSRLFRLEHRVDTLKPVEDEDVERTKE